MTQRISFYKDPDDRWYADLPEWQGDKAELEMVSGADILLDIIDQNHGETPGRVSLQLSTDAEPATPRHFTMTKLREDESGATYEVDYYDIVFEAWLCNVTIFVFGKFPDIFYVQN